MFEGVNNLIPNSLNDIVPWKIYEKITAKRPYIPIFTCSPFNYPMATAWHMKPQSIYPHTAKYRLFRAIVENDINEVKTILDENTIDIDNILEEKYGTTALTIAAWFNRTAIIKYLILRGAEIDKFDAKGNTALMLAVKNINYSAIALLVDAGADILLKDKFQLNCIDKARIRGFNILTEFLEKKAGEREEILRKTQNEMRKRPWDLPKFNIKFSFEEEDETFKSFVKEKKHFQEKPQVYPFNDFQGNYFVNFFGTKPEKNENT